MRLREELARAQRQGTGLACLLIDLDHFKDINDRYGHLAGDECLRQVGQAIKGVLRRPGDIATRYGGEEFAVILPATDEASVAALAEHVRKAVFALAIEHDANPAGVVTISAGVASLMPEAFNGNTNILVHLADQALYCAKRNGRNSIVCASSLEHVVV